MIKLIIFDLDGVLVEAKKIHFDSLNKALSIFNNDFVIDKDEHLNKYDGLKTNQKLEMLTKQKNLPIELHSKVWELKQKYTIDELRNLKSDEQIISTISKLSKDGYKIACCSNSIRKTVLTVLSKLEIIEYFDYIISNEDVTNSKPHPEIYWTAMSKLSFLPEETLIIEDSPHGLQAAYRSNSNIFRVENTTQVTYDNIVNKINNIEKNNMKNIPKWINKKMNVLIPMAGAGSRFEKAGFTFPKPLIEVNGKPMIQVVIENMNIDANFIYVVQKSHREKYNLDTLLNLITPNCKVVEVDGITEGAACTALLAKEFINNEQPLFFANSDQFIEWNSNDFFYKMQETDVDGGIVTFEATHPKWSFVKVDENGFVVEVAEKNPISNIATVGFYYWKSGSDFVNYAEQMIEEDIRVNNEFYVCPVFNQAIRDSKRISVFNIEKMWGLGTPEDLDFYIKNFKNI